jgi:transposase
VRQGPGALRQALPSVLAQRTDVLSPRIIHLIEGLIDDWRQFDQQIADVTREIGLPPAAAALF